MAIKNAYVALKDILEKYKDINELGLLYHDKPDHDIDHFVQVHCEHDEPDPTIPIHLYEKNTKLGISLWIASSLMDEAKKEYNIIKEKQTLDANMVVVTSIMLLINADHYTCWNIRKKLLREGILQVKDEVKFLNLLLTKHPKSEESFQHRKFLLRTYFIKQEHDDWITRELKAADIGTENYKRNYYAWDYKHVVVHAIRPQKKTLKRLSESIFPDALAHLKKHVSDNSSATFVQYVLNTMIELANNKDEVFQVYSAYFKACVTNFQMIYFYPGHETLWHHRRFLMHFHMKTLLPKLTAFYHDNEQQFLSMHGEQLRPLFLGMMKGETNFLKAMFHWPPMLQSEHQFMSECTTEKHIENAEEQRQHGFHYFLWYVTFVHSFPDVQQRVINFIPPNDPLVRMLPEYYAI